mmetsp:Transcript_16/g.27  ORF Transcript_16/g.27 Transcript_16/m.27 type:complete len:118 (+) Transcript_16:337-690(+)
MLPSLNILETSSMNGTKNIYRSLYHLQKSVRYDVVSCLENCRSQDPSVYDWWHAQILAQMGDGASHVEERKHEGVVLLQPSSKSQQHVPHSPMLARKDESYLRTRGTKVHPAWTADD